MEHTDIDELIIKYLFEGKTQSEISHMLKEYGIKPNSLSSVEKRLKEIKNRHNAKTMFHLGLILGLKKYLNKDI